MNKIDPSYVLSEDEWKLRDHEWILKKGDEAVRKAVPIFLEKQTRKGWSEPIAVYLLWCQDCKAHTITHPAGYGKITCLHCHQVSHRVMTWQRFRDKRMKPVLYWTPRVLLPPLLIAIVWLIVKR